MPNIPIGSYDVVVYDNNTSKETIFRNALSVYEVVVEEISPEIVALSTYKIKSTGGEQIFIYGNNFGSNLNITIGGHLVSIVSSTINVIVIETNQLNPGIYDLVVYDLSTNKYDELVQSITCYEEEIPGPVINGISVNYVESSKLDEILIFGENFNSNCEIYFQVVK